MSVRSRIVFVKFAFSVVQIAILCFRGGGFYRLWDLGYTVREVIVKIVKHGHDRIFCFSESRIPGYKRSEIFR